MISLKEYQAILAYMSDLNFIHTVAHSLGLRQYFNLGMITSIDHSMWFVSDSVGLLLC